MVVETILIDTNGYTAFKKGNKEVIDIVLNATQIFMSTIVIGELLGGFAFGNKELKNKQELNSFLNSPKVTIIGVSDRTATHYATIYRELRSKGRPIPTNDLWIAATAKELNCAVLSYDKHFRFINDMVVIPI